MRFLRVTGTAMVASPAWVSTFTLTAAGAAATAVLYNGTSASGEIVSTLKAAANSSNSFSFERGHLDLGIYIEVTGEYAEATLLYLPEWNVDVVLGAGSSPSASESISPSISQSKSSSVSASASSSISPSRSESTSPSASISASLSESASPSASISASRSVSASASISPSASNSISPSLSESKSASVSASGSASVSASRSASMSASESTPSDSGTESNLLPATGTDDPAVGEPTAEWQDPSRVTADDNSYAATPANVAVTHYLKGLNFNPGIDPAATITQIVLTVPRYTTSAGTVTDEYVYLVVGGVVSGNNKADTSTPWPGSEADATYTWTPGGGDTMPTAAQVNASDFGCVLAVDGDTSPGAARVDCFKMAITWAIY